MGAFSVNVALKTPGKDGVEAVRIPCGTPRSRTSIGLKSCSWKSGLI
jgi:hypothetical protein